MSADLVRLDQASPNLFDVSHSARLTATKSALDSAQLLYLDRMSYFIKKKACVDYA